MLSADHYEFRADALVPKISCGRALLVLHFGVNLEKAPGKTHPTVSACVRPTGYVLSLESLPKVTVSSIWVPKASATMTEGPGSQGSGLLRRRKGGAGKCKCRLFGPG